MTAKRNGRNKGQRPSKILSRGLLFIRGKKCDYNGKRGKKSRENGRDLTFRTDINGDFSDRSAQYRIKHLEGCRHGCEITRHAIFLTEDCARVYIISSSYFCNNRRAARADTVLMDATTAMSGRITTHRQKSSIYRRAQTD